MAAFNALSIGVGFFAVEDFMDGPIDAVTLLCGEVDHAAIALALSRID
jgi:hypothetical protein